MQDVTPSPPYVYLSSYPFELVLLYLNSVVITELSDGADEIMKAPLIKYNENFLKFYIFSNFLVII